MSLYNMVNGVNPATFFVLPMLGKHANDYPRFRDCWITKREWKIRDDGFPSMQLSQEQSPEPRIYVYTRVGGGNREDYELDIEVLREMPEYVTDYDDEFDYTYATFEFRVPERWMSDFEKVEIGELATLSKEYQDELYRIYPKLTDKLNELFGRVSTPEE